MLRAWESSSGCFLGLFCDTLHFHVRLDSADPGVQLCVYHYKGSHDPNTCYLTEQQCPGNRTYEYDTTDTSDFVIQVSRVASSTPTCTPYTVFVSQNH